MDRKKLKISVEGNIGSGKSTLIEFLTKQNNRYLGIPEPIDAWRNVNGLNFLDLMYQNKSKWSFHFQLVALTTMLENNFIQSDKPAIITERSLLSIKHIFTKYLSQNQILTIEDIAVLDTIFNCLLTKCNVGIPNIIIYLQTRPEIAFDRIKQRQRAEENDIDLNYIKDLNKLHDDWLLKNKSDDITIFVIDANKSWENILVQVHLVEKYIDKILQNGDSE